MATASALAITAAGLAAAAPASAATVTHDFTHTGDVQTWTVPNGVTSATFVLYGAEGGAAGESLQHLGGQGGNTTATLALTPGQVLELRVGGAGQNSCIPPTPPLDRTANCTARGGYNGGGDALGHAMNEEDIGLFTWPSGGAGGGASDLRFCASPGSCALLNRALVAGGGGGASVECGAGGSGGGTSGGDGCGERPGLGGSQTGGGASGDGDPEGSVARGSLGQGGRAQSGPGAGGGGYYGGGGGADGSPDGGGGGGSGYITTLATDATTTNGVREGHGLIQVTFQLPEVSITSGPQGLTNNASPSFTFSSNPSGFDLECRLVGLEASFSPCSSPQAYSDLDEGDYTFEVRSVEGGSTVSPAQRSFILDTTAPTTTITSGPTGTTTDRTPTFGFQADDSGATFECSITQGPPLFGPCYGPDGTHTLPTPLANGDYTFSVRATDQAGNQETNPPTRSFSVRADREAETPEVPLVMRLRAPNPQQGFGAARGLIVCQGGDCVAELKGTVRIRRGSGRPSLVIPLRFEQSTLALEEGEIHEFVARLTPRARRAARRAEASGRRVVARVRAVARFEDGWSVQSNLQRVRLTR